MFDKLIDRLSADKTKAASNDALQSQPTRFAPNTKIAYKPNLVNVLEKEHKGLLSVYWKALAAAQNHKSDLTRKHLIELKDLLVEHLLKENTSLYIYLSHSARQPSTQEAIRAVKSDMDKLGRSIKNFLDRAIQPEASYDADFVERLKLVGDALTERIEKEESYVYPNYRPN